MAEFRQEQAAADAYNAATVDIDRLEHPNSFSAVVQSFNQQAGVLNLGANIGDAVPYVATAPVAAPYIASVTKAATNSSGRASLLES
jgi:hypothetical protein